MSDIVETATSERATSEGRPLPEVDKGQDAAATRPPPSLRVTALSIADRALQFLSTASNETLGVCLVGLGATTYLLLGRVGLVLIGVVGGVALHASWDGTIRAFDVSKDAANEDRRRREVALDVAQRVLEWRKEREGDELGKSMSQSTSDLQLLAGTKLDYSSFRPETAGALTEFTDAVVRDYVKWWYSPILPDDDRFPTSCEQTLVAFIHSMSAHLWRKRPEDTFLNFLTNSSSIVVVYLEELLAAVTAAPNVPTEEAIEFYLEQKPTSNLANLIDTASQRRKLDIVAEDILECYLDTKSYNCKPVKTFLREVLAKLILEATVQKCSTEEFINGWIIYLLEDGEPATMKELESPLQDVVQEAAESALKDDATAPSDSQTIEMKKKREQQVNHRRVVSRAQEAMDEAMQEARRLTQMIQEEEARKAQKEQDRLQRDTSTSPTVSNLDGARSPPLPQRHNGLNSRSITASVASSFDDASEGNEHPIPTPTSSQADSHDLPAGSASERPADAASMHTNPFSESDVEAPHQSFTSFDQLIPNQVPTALSCSAEPSKPQPPPLSLHDARITILDDSVAGDREARVALKTKPATDYLIQIEPRTAHYPGWMIIRKYADFENLHEVIKRISVVSGVPEFSQAHSLLPAWKGSTRTQLCDALERYLTDAVRFRALAESEAMKRFLEKDQALSRAGTQPKFGGLGWPTPAAFETMGKGMIDALTKAPKEVAGGGKALLGGVTGVFTGGNASKRNSVPVPASSPAPSRHSTSSSVANARLDESRPSLQLGRKSDDSLSKVMSSGYQVVDSQPSSQPPMERKPSYPTEGTASPRLRGSSRSRHGASSNTNSGRSSVRQSMDNPTPVLGGDQILSLPPPPSAMPDDYNIIEEEFESPPLKPPRSQTNSSSKQPTQPQEDDATVEKSPLSRSDVPQRRSVPLSEQETQMTVELVFAMITSFYSLSSAWTLRRTLLTAAKSFLLRPGNPQLDSIRQLVQSTVIESNTSDAGIAAHILKLRENALPTEAELAAWPPPPTDEEKRKMKEKARKLLEERGMPAALTGVMGLAASKEAVSRVFDSLMIDKVARGLVFGVMLQALRTVTQ